jgi:hypothetical protein
MCKLLTLVMARCIGMPLRSPVVRSSAEAAPTYDASTSTKRIRRSTPTSYTHSRVTSWTSDMNGDEEERCNQHEASACRPSTHAASRPARSFTMLASSPYSETSDMLMMAAKSCRFSDTQHKIVRICERESRTRRCRLSFANRSRPRLTNPPPRH